MRRLSRRAHRDAGDFAVDKLALLSDQGDFLEIWQKEPDGVWRIIEAIWNTRLPAFP